MSPKVTVIMPTFNSADYVARTLDSVFSQDHDRLEVIVVDDGSTDTTLQVLNAYPKPLQIYTQSNLGPAAARNRALDHATGDLLTFIDSDDIWLPDKLRMQIDLMGRQPELDMCYTDFFFWRPNSAGVFANPETFVDSTVGDEIDAEMSGWIYPEIFLDSVVHIITAMIRPRILDTAGRFDTSLATGSDMEFWLRMSRHTQMVKLRRKLALYRIHQGSITFRPRTRNFGFEILAGALEKYGYAAPDGRALDPKLVRERLAKVSFNFGQLHWQRGDLGVAREAFRRTARHRPFWIRNRLFQVFAAARQLASP